MTGGLSILGASLFFSRHLILTSIVLLSASMRHSLRLVIQLLMLQVQEPSFTQVHHTQGSESDIIQTLSHDARRATLFASQIKQYPWQGQAVLTREYPSL